MRWEPPSSFFPYPSSFPKATQEHLGGCRHLFGAEEPGGGEIGCGAYRNTCDGPHYGDKFITIVRGNGGAQ